MRIRLSVSYHSPCSRHFSTSTTSCVSALKNPAVICPFEFPKTMWVLLREPSSEKPTASDTAENPSAANFRLTSAVFISSCFLCDVCRRLQPPHLSKYLQRGSTLFPLFSRISFTSQITAFPLFLFTSHKTSSSGRVFATTYFSRREKQRRSGRRQVFRF